MPLPKTTPGADAAGAPMWPVVPCSVVAAVTMVLVTSPLVTSPLVLTRNASKSLATCCSFKSARAGGSIERAPPVAASAPLGATTCWMVVVAWWRMTSIDERARARLLRRLLAGDSVSQAMSHERATRKTHHPPLSTRGASAQAPPSYLRLVSASARSVAAGVGWRLRSGIRSGGVVVRERGAARSFLQHAGHRSIAARKCPRGCACGDLGGRQVDCGGSGWMAV